MVVHNKEIVMKSKHNTRRRLRVLAEADWLDKIVSEADSSRLVSRVLRPGGMTASELAAALKPRGLEMTTVRDTCYISRCRREG